MKECPKETMENEYLKIEMTERSSMLAYIDMINPCINCIGCGDYGVGCCFCQYEEMYGNITTIMTLTEDFGIEQARMAQVDLQAKVDTYEANIVGMYDLLCDENGEVGRTFSGKLGWRNLRSRDVTEEFHWSWEPWYRIAMQRNHVSYISDDDLYPSNCRKIAGYGDTIMTHWHSPGWNYRRCHCQLGDGQVAKLFEVNKKIVEEICNFCNEVENIALMKIAERPFSELGAGLDNIRTKLEETMKKEEERK